MPLETIPDSSPPKVEGTWLVSGGLGKLGRLVVERLAELGAGALALLSRRQPDDEELAWLAGLREKGVVGLWTADLTDLQELEGALEQIRSHQGPLRGVVHCAGLLDDGVLTEQTWERFLPVLAPKLEGAWNLHLTTRQDPLEAFFLFSSVAATLGSAGQANYSAANAFLEALAEARQAEGLPALAIGWGPGRSAWVPDSAPNTARRLERQGLGFLPPQEGLGLFQSLLGRGGRVLALRWTSRPSAPGWAGSCAPWPSSSPLRRRAGALLHLEPETLVRLHASRIWASLRRIWTRDPLRDYGLDSLMALELRKALSELWSGTCRPPWPSTSPPGRAGSLPEGARGPAFGFRWAPPGYEPGPPALPKSNPRRTHRGDRDRLPLSGGG